jgi:hypothetical protein
VREARPTAFWIASSMLFSEEPATWMIAAVDVIVGHCHPSLTEWLV